MLGFMNDLFEGFADTLMVASTAGNILSTGMSAYGAAKEAKADEATLRFNEQQYRENVQFAEREARDAVKRGSVTERRARIATRQLVGTQRARIAANNIRVDSGSAKRVQMDAAMLGELDALTIRENAAREARGLLQEARNFGSQAAMAGRAADDVSPFLSAAPTILTGASTVADQWLRYRHGS